MNNKKKEGSFYASKVRLFLNEYGGENLQEFCKAENVSYTKMCHCLGRPAYRKPKVASAPPGGELDESDTVLPVIDLQPLVVDMPKQSTDSSSGSASVLSSSKQRHKKDATKCDSLSDVSITISGRLDVRIGSCEVGTLVILMREMEVAL